MIRNVAAAALVLLLGVAVAADDPKFTSTWTSPDAAGEQFAGRKVAALVITSDINLQMSAEEQLVRELEKREIAATASYRLMPREELISAEKARPWFERAGVDGVVSLRPVKVESTRTYVPSLWVTSSYSTLWGYYGYGWTSVYSAGDVRTDTTLVVETLVHSLKRDKLLWAGVSTTTNPAEAQRFITVLVREAVEVMRKQKLVK